MASTRGACLAEAPAAGVRKLGEVQVDFADPPSDAPVPRVDHPYFDAAGRLSWVETPVPVAAERRCEVRARLRDPRVDERSCARVEGRQEAGTTLVGLDLRGSVTWCAGPQVVVGTKGYAGFAYTDLNTRKHVLVHYRMAP